MDIAVKSFSVRSAASRYRELRNLGSPLGAPVRPASNVSRDESVRVFGGAQEHPYQLSIDAAFETEVPISLMRVSIISDIATIFR